jgi:hypothetical protein
MPRHRQCVDVIGHSNDNNLQTRKHTAWKKNRKFGDVWGGRTFPKLADKIFNQQHNLTAPAIDETIPIYIVDNPSRDFYFPVTVDEIKSTLEKLPNDHTDHLTHIWLQKIKKTEYLDGNTFQGCFICGSNVYLIVLHPFPIDNKMRFGKNKPLQKTLNYYKNFTTDLKENKEGWYLQWTEETIKRYFLESLLLHEIGHSLDSFYKRYWSKTTKAKSENFADNYVAVWSDRIREKYEPKE